MLLLISISLLSFSTLSANAAAVNTADRGYELFDLPSCTTSSLRLSSKGGCNSLALTDSIAEVSMGHEDEDEETEEGDSSTT